MAMKRAEKKEAKNIELPEDIGNPDIKEFIRLNKQGLITCTKYPEVLFHYDRTNQTVLVQPLQTKHPFITNFLPDSLYEKITGPLKTLMGEINKIEIDLVDLSPGKKNSL